MKDDESWLEPCLDDYKSDCALSLNEKIPYWSGVGHYGKEKSRQGRNGSVGMILLEASQPIS